MAMLSEVMENNESCRTTSRNWEEPDSTFGDCGNRTSAPFAGRGSWKFHLLVPASVPPSESPTTSTPAAETHNCPPPLECAALVVGFGPSGESLVRTWMESLAGPTFASRLVATVQWADIDAASTSTSSSSSSSSSSLGVTGVSGHDESDWDGGESAMMTGGGGRGGRRRGGGGCAAMPVFEVYRATEGVLLGAWGGVSGDVPAETGAQWARELARHVAPKTVLILHAMSWHTLWSGLQVPNTPNGLIDDEGYDREEDRANSAFVMCSSSVPKATHPSWVKTFPCGVLVSGAPAAFMNVCQYTGTPCVMVVAGLPPYRRRPEPDLDTLNTLQKAAILVNDTIGPILQEKMPLISPLLSQKALAFSKKITDVDWLYV